VHVLTAIIDYCMAKLDDEVNAESGVWVLRAQFGACLWIRLICGRHGLRRAVGLFKHNT